MAVDICSPRISFSQDLKEPDGMPIDGQSRRPDSLLLDSIDFDFRQTTFSLDHLSSADELFKNGKMLPFEFKKSTPMSKKETQVSAEIIHRSSSSGKNSSEATLKMNPDENIQKKSLKELLSISPEEDEHEKKRPSSYAKIPFWHFKRSTSLNLESSRNSSLIRSLNFLSRSNSTGSVPNLKPAGVVTKVINKQNSEKERPIKPRSDTNQYYSFSNYKSNSSSRKNYMNRVNINPILNIPIGCISRSSISVFGLGSFFCNAKTKRKKS